MGYPSNVKILVTGCLGFVGYKLSEMLTSKGHEVHGVDGMEEAAYSALSRIQNLDQLRQRTNFYFHQDSWPSLEGSKILAKSDFDTVVNLAALPGLNTSWIEPEKIFRSNVALVQDILNSISNSESRTHFVHASTSSVYGSRVPNDENGALQPVSPYGISKMAAEQLIDIYKPNLKQKPTVLRLFSLYGPGQRADMGYYRFIDQALRGEPLTIAGSLKQTRRNTFIDDAARAFVSIIEDKIDGTYNVVGDEEVSLKEAVHTIVKISGHSGNIQVIPARKGEQSSTNGSNLRLKTETGWAPKVSFEIGIQRQFEWQRSLPLGE